MLYIGKIKLIKPNAHTGRERWEKVGNKMRGRCAAPTKKAFPIKRKPMDEKAHQR